MNTTRWYLTHLSPCSCHDCGRSWTRLLRQKTSMRGYHYACLFHIFVTKLAEWIFGFPIMHLGTWFPLNNRERKEAQNVRRWSDHSLPCIDKISLENIGRSYMFRDWGGLRFALYPFVNGWNSTRIVLIKDTIVRNSSQESRYSYIIIIEQLSYKKCPASNLASFR